MCKKNGCASVLIKLYTDLIFFMKPKFSYNIYLKFENIMKCLGNVMDGKIIPISKIGLNFFFITLEKKSYGRKIFIFSLFLYEIGYYKFEKKNYSDVKVSILKYIRKLMCVTRKGVQVY